MRDSNFALEHKKEGEGPLDIILFYVCGLFP